MIPAAASSVTSPFPALISAWPSLPACPAPHTSRVEIWHGVAPHPSCLAWTSVTIYWALTPTICFSPDKEVLAPSWVTPQTRNLPFLWSHGQFPHTTENWTMNKEDALYRCYWFYQYIRQTEVRETCKLYNGDVTGKTPTETLPKNNLISSPKNRNENKRWTFCLKVTYNTYPPTTMCGLRLDTDSNKKNL